MLQLRNLLKTTLVTLGAIAPASEQEYPASPPIEIPSIFTPAIDFSLFVDPPVISPGHEITSPSDVFSAIGSDFIDEIREEYPIEDIDFIWGTIQEEPAATIAIGIGWSPGPVLQLIKAGLTTSTFRPGTLILNWEALTVQRRWAVESILKTRYSLSGLAFRSREKSVAEISRLL